jgi:hypothetical protein
MIKRLRSFSADHPEAVAVLAWLFRSEVERHRCGAAGVSEVKQRLFCKSRISEVGHLASMFR